MVRHYEHTHTVKKTTDGQACITSRERECQSWYTILENLVLTVSITGTLAKLPIASVICQFRQSWLLFTVFFCSTQFSPTLRHWYFSLFGSVLELSFGLSVFLSVGLRLSLTYVFYLPLSPTLSTVSYGVFFTQWWKLTHSISLCKIFIVNNGKICHF